jgi:single-strand DNA-binding protein
MSKDLNQCNFIGRLGKDPEVKHMPNGNAVVNFSIACGDDYKKDGQKVEQTNWINVVAFGKLAEIIGEYLKKGSRVFISGKLTVRKWQDKEGNDRYTTEIVASEMQMLDSRSGSQAPASQSAQVAGEDFNDSIPF